MVRVTRSERVLLPVVKYGIEVILKTRLDSWLVVVVEFLLVVLCFLMMKDCCHIPNELTNYIKMKCLPYLGGTVCRYGNRNNKIRVWKMEHGSTHWQKALLEVTHAINSQIHSVTGRSPYDIVFRQPMRGDKWVTSQERSVKPLHNEDGTTFNETTLAEPQELEHIALLQVCLLYVSRIIMNLINT